MLLHALSNPANDVLFNQFCYEVHGSIDVQAFQDAWQRISDRHQAFRTGFVWKTLKEPLQVVRQQIVIPFSYIDLRAKPEHEQQCTLNAFYKSDREQSIDIGRAPLNRFSLFRCSDNRSVLIWSSHHLILDRWCVSTIFDEFFKLYEIPNATLDAPFSYRNYVEWTRQQDISSAKSYWTELLLDFTTPSILTTARPVTTKQVCDLSGQTGCIEFGTESSRQLRELANGNRLSLSAVIQGAWALLLNEYTGHQDVVFGIAASGRPPDLEGVESIIGTFVNNLPMRVRLSVDATIRECLLGCQAAQQARNAFEYVSLPTIRECSQVSADQPLFDTLIVSLSPITEVRSGSLSFNGLNENLLTAHPLTLGIAEIDGAIGVSAHCHPRYRTTVPVDELLAHFKMILDFMLELGLDARLSEFPGFKGTQRYATSVVVSKQPVAATPLKGTDAWTTLGGRESNIAELLQDLVREEWRQVLGDGQLDQDADFFQLGGDSLQAANLHMRIEVATRQHVPLLGLFEMPTIRAMTKLLVDKKWPLKADVVTPVRAHGKKPPLFCVASPEVNTVGYALLARNLDADQPVYVVQTPPGSDEIRLLTMSELPTLAETYRYAVQAIQPNGPYHLIGMCSGANLAVEMAKQLVAEGQDVGFVGTINTWAHFTVSRWFYVRKVWRQLRWYRNRIGEVLKMPFQDQVATIHDVGERRLRTTRAALSHGLQRNQRVVDPVPDRPVGIRVKDATESVKYPGTITVFRIRKHNQSFWRIRDKGLGWGGEAQGAEVVELAGNDHNTLLMEPHVADLADKIRGVLTHAHDVRSRDIQNAN